MPYVKLAGVGKRQRGSEAKNLIARTSPSPEPKRQKVNPRQVWFPDEKGVKRDKYGIRQRKERVKLLPESEQIFRGMKIFYLPDRDTDTLMGGLTRWTVNNGGEWARHWSSDVSIVVVTRWYPLHQAAERLEQLRPFDAPVVTHQWLTDAAKAKKCAIPPDSKYLLATALRLAAQPKQQQPRFRIPPEASQVTYPDNIYKDQNNACQSDETAESFLSRLPPNKHNLGREKSLMVARSGAVKVHVNKEIVLQSFRRQGTQILNQLDDKWEESNQKACPKAPREQAVNDILDLAKAHGLTRGKWLVFLSHDRTHTVWSEVVSAVKQGKLGTAAILMGPRDSRYATNVIKVYTDDFSDEADVYTALQHLKSCIGTASTRYKPSAFTLLNLDGSNPYGMKMGTYQWDMKKPTPST